MLHTLNWSSLRTSALLPAFVRRVMTILAAREKARQIKERGPALNRGPKGHPAAANTPAPGTRINVPPVEALTALLTRRVRGDARYKHLVLVWSTLRAGDRDSWDSSAGYGLVPESTLKLAKAQLEELSAGRDDPRLTLLMLQMTRRISELEAKRIADEQRIEAARARLAAAEASGGAPAAKPKPVLNDAPGVEAASGFAPTQPMDFTRIPPPRGAPAVVLMTNPRPPTTRPGAAGSKASAFSVVEIFDAEYPTPKDAQVVDFRDTETFTRVPPDEQALLPAFELLPMN